VPCGTSVVDALQVLGELIDPPHAAEPGDTSTTVSATMAAPDITFRSTPSVPVEMKRGARVAAAGDFAELPPTISRTPTDAVATSDRTEGTLLLLTPQPERTRANNRYGNRAVAYHGPPTLLLGPS
jgi:hypothetical protein